MESEAYTEDSGYKKSSKDTINYGEMIMFLPAWRAFTAIFVYYLTLEALKKAGLIKSK